VGLIEDTKRTTDLALTAEGTSRRVVHEPECIAVLPVQFEGEGRTIADAETAATASLRVRLHAPAISLRNLRRREGELPGLWPLDQGAQEVG